MKKTATKKISNAKGLYLEAIREGKFHDALDKYTGERYTQHSTGVPDGKEGFAQFFESFVERNPIRDIQIVRAIEDGQYVFLHVYQSLNDGKAQWVTADLFDTDENDKLIEHWDVIQEYAAETRSGRSMVDGPCEVEDLEKTEANKRHVQALFDNILLSGDFGNVADYISAKQYEQHNPAMADGLDGLRKHNQELREKGRARKYWKVHRLIGQGNFVVTLSHLQDGNSHYAIFDIFRLKDGLIVEHWDVQEKILAPEEWNNVGKF